MTRTVKMPPTPTANSPRAVILGPWVGRLAGAMGAALALAAGELFSGFTSKVPSLVIAMGEVFVDKTPGAVVESGIQAAGTNDKPILLATVTIAALLIGAALGNAALRNRRVSDVGFAVFGLVGAWAAARNPFASNFWATVAALAAATIGALTVRMLLGLASLPVVNNRANNAAANDAFPARRVFLGMSGAAAVTALLGTSIGRALRDNRSVEGVRQSIAIPPASSGSSGAVAQTLPGTLDAVPGISSYVTPNSNFYRIDTALTVPQVDPNSWKLSIGGLVDNPYELTFDEISNMDLVEHAVTLSCVSNPIGDKYVGNAVWTGVPLTTLLDRAGVQTEGKQIVGISVDDFDASFPTELAYDGRTAMLAIGMNGEPLPVIHGFPARLVVAGLYGYVSAVKWIKEIRLVDEDYDAYWIPRGWSKLGPIKTMSRIDVPRGEITAGDTAIGGVAWAPNTGIAKVEVSIDEGDWQECTLGSATSDDTWVQWKLDWAATKGDHQVKVRATDKTGFTQSPTRVSTAPNGAEGHHTVKIKVS